jgi:hypothetical protein
MSLSRREFGMAAMAAAGTPAPAAKIDPRHNGVILGVQSYSFRDRGLDEAIAAMKSIGLGLVELWSGHVEPKASREDLRKWRLTAPLDHFKTVRRKFEDAGSSCTHTTTVFATILRTRKSHAGLRSPRR